MLTRRQTGIALRCSACGNTNIFPVSLFSLKSSRREFQCSCGQHILTASRKGTDVWLQLSCFLCDGVHLFKFGDKAFWSRDIKSILCPDTSAEIGYIGPMWGLLKVADIREEGLSKVAALFDDPDAGLGILTKLAALDDKGKLRCSRCDTSLEIEAYPRGVELWCAKCGTSLFAPVGDPEVGERAYAQPAPEILYDEGVVSVELASPAAGGVGAKPARIGRRVGEGGRDSGEPE
ncbi:MAG: hypothetical protein HPY55_03735 [Firmicutes bacterium]|nr:hypothetical protein [Bacillota bacterium]